MCGMNQTCPVHGRNDVKDAVQNNLAARAVTYLGKYVVATLDNPEYQSPMAALSALFGQEAPNALGALFGKKAPNMFMHLVVEVGETGTLGDVLDAEQLKAKTVFRDTFLAGDDERLLPFVDDLSAGVSDKFNAKLTEIMHESHDLVVDSVRNKVIG